jgi:hypothetical protein
MKKLFWTLGGILIIVAGIYLYNFMTIIHPTTSKINADSRNDGIYINVHYKNYIEFSTLVFNLTTIRSNKAAADVFRVFLQTTSALNDKKFDKVELQLKGTTKFVLKGDYFKQLGNEYEEQNPVYTIRTFPENLYLPNGESAYSKWEGGMLGVFSKQMDDFNDFNNKWYLEDLEIEIRK